MKIGSLCSGYGGLDMAVEVFYDAETVWMCDIDKAASKVIFERWQLPNLGNLKTVDWSSVEPIDILTAGYPCQPFSNAGKRKGSSDPRHIWPDIKQIISVLRPRIVILENVGGHLTLGFKEVLQDLTEIGYDARWEVVRASDAGAPHRRERLFILAEPTNSNGIRRDIRKFETKWNKGQSQFEPAERSQIASYPNGEAYEQSRRVNQSIYESASESIDSSNRDEYRGNSQTATNTDDSGRVGHTSKLWRRFDSPFQMSMLRAPDPLVESKLNTKFVEYMMGLPAGWVTDLDLSRSQQFKLLGNGVVPQQAYLALQILNKVVQIVRQ